MAGEEANGTSDAWIGGAVWIVVIAVGSVVWLVGNTADVLINVSTSEVAVPSAEGDRAVPVAVRVLYGGAPVDDGVVQLTMVDRADETRHSVDLALGENGVFRGEIALDPAAAVELTAHYIGRQVDPDGGKEAEKVTGSASMHLGVSRPRRGWRPA